MPIFVILCLILATVVQTESPIQSLLVSPVFIYVGLAIAMATVIAGYFKRLPEIISYDLFASSTLFVWYAYWKPLFVADSPIFFFFPVYFALVVAFVSLFFIGQRHNIDKDNLQRMQAIADSGVFSPWLVMVAVIITLYFENRFIQFPSMMTVLSIRYALSGCLNAKNKKQS